ncbi:MAG: hypothetical protein PVH11_07890 [Anaerolineae bacterium]|jgi:S1-C subfamily serine protease
MAKRAETISVWALASLVLVVFLPNLLGVGADLPARLIVGDSDGLRVGQFVLAIGNS